MDLTQGTQQTRRRTINRSSRGTETGEGSPRLATHAEERPALDRIFKALADSTRREILHLLIERRMAVNEIVDHFHLTQPSISRHLAILRAAGLVCHQRRGQRVIYRLGEPELIGIAIGFLGSLAPRAERRSAI
jgi:DNA-binding transcriptional ArsR family regulator